MRREMMLALAGAVLVACHVEQADGAAPPPAELAVTGAAACEADSLCFVAAWPQARDSLGAADGYRIHITSSAGLDLTSTVGEALYRFALPCSPGASGTVTVAVWSIRRDSLSRSSTDASAPYSCPDAPPPAPDSVLLTPDEPPVAVDPLPVDSTPSSLALFAVPRTFSPHFDFARHTFTDFCYCWDKPGAKAAAALRYDQEMSGDLASWQALNPTMERLRYSLMQTTFTEEPDTLGKLDPDGITGRWQFDAREWFRAHPEYQYESMWLHDTTTGTPADSVHRLRRLIWANYRYAINPLDPGARAYTVDRLRRVKAGAPAATGIFLDEMDAGALSWIALAREGRGVATQVWQDSVVSLVAEIRKALAPGMVQTNAAAYSMRPFDMRVGVAAGSMHLEQLNRATQEMPAIWTFVDSLVQLGVYVDLVNLETFGDFARYGPGFYPPGNYADAVGRGETFQLASYYMVVRPDAQLVGLHETGQRNPVTPDSTDLAIYYLDVGDPVGERRVVLDTRDALSQRARVYQRDFSRAVVLIRPVVYWGDTRMTDTTAVPVPLPEGGPWSMVLARGGIRPLDSLQLRNSEAVILVRR